MAKVQIKICPKCGARNDISELFCNNCQQSFSNITSPQPMAAGAQTHVVINQPQTNPVFSQNPTHPPVPMIPNTFAEPMMDTHVWCQRLMSFWSATAIWLSLGALVYGYKTGFGRRDFIPSDATNLMFSFVLFGVGSYFFLRGHHGRSYTAFRINVGLLILASIATIFVPMK